MAKTQLTEELLKKTILEKGLNEAKALLDRGLEDLKAKKAKAEADLASVVDNIDTLQGTFAAAAKAAMAEMGFEPAKPAKQAKVASVKSKKHDRGLEWDKVSKEDKERIVSEVKKLLKGVSQSMAMSVSNLKNDLGDMAKGIDITQGVKDLYEAGEIMRLKIPGRPRYYTVA